MALVSDVAGSTDPAYQHFAIVPSDTVELTKRPRAIYFQTDGTAALKDELGVTVTYTRFAGDILPIRPKYVMATGTSATLVGWI